MDATRSPRVLSQVPSIYLPGEDGLFPSERSWLLQGDVPPSGSKCPPLNLVDDREHHPFTRSVLYTISHVTQLLHQDRALVGQTQAGLFRIIGGPCSGAILFAVVTTRALLPRVAAFEDQIHTICDLYYRCVPPVRTYWVDERRDGRPLRAPLAGALRSGQAPPNTAPDKYLGEKKFEDGFERDVIASMLGSYKRLEVFAKATWAAEAEEARRLSATRESVAPSAARESVALSAVRESVAGSAGGDRAADGPSRQAGPQTPHAAEAARTGPQAPPADMTPSSEKGQEVAKDKRGASGLKAFFARKGKSVKT